jgi:hypothetical protein
MHHRRRGMLHADTRLSTDHSSVRMRRRHTLVVHLRRKHSLGGMSVVLGLTVILAGFMLNR